MIESSLISVIIPVYNSEKYLKECMLSIINQSYKNLEIIIINDGSTDKSIDICQNLASLDSRIKIINQKNMGAAAAKNTGLDNVKGSWCMIVDSDDILSTNAIETLYKSANKLNVDIIQGDYTSDYNIFIQNNKELISSESSFNSTSKFIQEEAIYKLIIDSNFNQMPWNKLYKSELIENIRFPKGKYIDDEYWTYKVFDKAHSIGLINNILYYYRKHEMSTMGKEYSLKRLDALDALNERVSFMKERYPDLEQIARKRFLDNGIFNFQKLCQFDHLDPNKLIREQIMCQLIMHKKEYLKYKEILNKDILLYKIFFKFPYLMSNIRNLLRRGI